MIDREKLYLHLKDDLDYLASSEADASEKFMYKYQLERLNCKENDGTVSDQHKQDAFSNFLVLQEDLQEFNSEVSFVENLYPEEFARTRSIISELLPCLETVWGDVWELCTFGPGTFHGAIKSLKGTGYSTLYKIGGDQTVTPKARGLALEVIQEFFPNWAENLATSGQRLRVVPGNRLAYVPKDVRKCRPIAIEPSLNVFLQQGVGRFLGRRLRNTGFADIYDGQQVQRDKASNLGNATIDLSNASDTISIGLVKRLLPTEWFELFDTVRSHDWSYKDRSGTYENISSQGNAFTFPLETMIFKAILMGFLNLSSSQVTVYGDDIILPVRFASEAVDALELCGFTVNKEKSYYGQHDGELALFRESCGADYYNGVCVTPVYYRENATHYSDIATLFNRLYETYGYLPKVHGYLLRLVPESHRLWGPMDFISDGSDEFWSDQKRKKFPLFNQINSIVRVYSSWFWIIPELMTSTLSSKRAWIARDRKISKKFLLDDRSRELCFLFGAPETVARWSRLSIRKVDVTGFSGRPPFALRDRRYEEGL